METYKISDITIRPVAMFQFIGKKRNNKKMVSNFYIMKVITFEAVS